MQIIEEQKQAPSGLWAIKRYDMDTCNGMARYVARRRYARPGGYELFAITDDGGILCNDCCRSEYWHIAHSDAGDGWHVAGVGSDDCMEEPSYCDHCSKAIGPEHDD